MMDVDVPPPPPEAAYASSVGRAPPPPSRAGADDDDDDIVLRIPVQLRPADDRMPLCLFQYPLRPRWRPYHLDELKAARVRPEQRQVDFTLGMECDPSHYDEDSPAPLSSIQLASTSTRKHPTSYAIAMLRTDEQGTPTALSLTPLSTTVQLRPSFAQLNSGEASPDSSTKGTPARSPRGGRHSDTGADSGVGDEDDMEEGEEGGEASMTPLPTPLFRPAQTEREIEARRSSHAFLVEEREKEPWSQVQLHTPDSDASVSIRDHFWAHR